MRRRPASPSLRHSAHGGYTCATIWMMIDAEMYGMTPSAKIDSRDSAPPENMLNRPRIVPSWSWKNFASAIGSMPGVGMKVPMRYTIRPPSRNSRRWRISVWRAAWPIPGIRLLSVLDTELLDAAAGRLDRGPRTLGRGEALDRDRRAQLARQDDLDLLDAGRHRARRLQRREVDRTAALGREPLERAERDLAAGRLDRRAEAHLGQAPLQRHLAALEADLVVAALAGALALDAAAAGLALAGGRAAPDPQSLLLAARRGLHVVQFHCTTFA